MGATTHVATSPAQLVRAPANSSLYQLITVTNAAAATLTSLLAGAVIPTIAVPNHPNKKYTINYVDLQADIDPLTIAVRYTDDGQTAPTATLGFVLPGGNSTWVRIPTSPDDIQLISTGGDVTVQVRLGILGTE